ncbi:MAG: 4Fe-4S dicluster domain-containing protein [Bacteroidales bacterium]|nr:4Fe-4S dicluster domain-containing protein [Bacteroidales bacterium]
MANINPKFGEKLKEYGAENFNACYNCGTCTAVCSLSTPEDSFPRNMVRCSTLGQDQEIEASLKPWLCYYCGECSLHCPQDANPGELMMSLRRWLTAKYDWTGFSGLLYKSLAVTLISLIVVALGVVGFAYQQNFELESLMHYGHYFEMIAIGSVFAVVLVPNIIRMWYFVIIKPKKKVAFATYFKASGDFFVHMFTQKRSLGCDDNQVRWFEHLILVFGYLALLFTTVFLDWFDSKNLFVIALGYIESIAVFVITADFVNSRLKKQKAVSTHSQPSDWLFVVGLLLMGFTAFLVRLAIDMNMIQSQLWIFIVHLIVLAQWALIVVPFGKWTHFLYRSFAMYFAKLIELSK